MDNSKGNVEADSRLKHPHRVLITALFVAWAFDFLFWHKSPGVSFAIYVALLLIAGFLLAYEEGKPPVGNILWLLIPITIFAIMTTIRLEPMTVFDSVLLTLTLMMVLAHTFLGGRWMEYKLTDYGTVAMRLLGSALGRAPTVLRQIKQDRVEDPDSSAQISWRSLLPILRGLLLALPVVIFFSLLLSSADPIFADRLSQFLELFNLRKLGEYLFRGFYILMLAYGFTGIYLYALTTSQDEKLTDVDRPSPPGLQLGFIESGIVLGCVNLLFIAFVVIQFQYFFGGSSNISYGEFTFSQYARRGFGELIGVAFFSFLLFLSLSSFTKRDTPTERRVYSGLGVLLGILVGVILVSAFQRLLLYESTFGFTRLRTYPHIFMVWLGILLLVFIALEVAGWTRFFGLALFASCLGFGLTLGLLNVDGVITRENVERAVLGHELDTDYLLTLSVDSTPVLVELFDSPDLNSKLQDEVGVVLACQAGELRRDVDQQTWTGFHFSEWRALRLLEDMDEALLDYPVSQQDGDLVVIVNGGERSCKGKWWLD